jgi:hypothetical protein
MPLTRRGQFNAWKFRQDLILHGPPYFKQLLDRHWDPEIIEQIPIKKLEHMPARAMDINQSKVSGNKDAIADLLRQGGVGDPTDEDDHDDEWEPDIINISPYVVLIMETSAHASVSSLSWTNEQSKTLLGNNTNLWSS